MWFIKFIETELESRLHSMSSKGKQADRINFNFHMANHCRCMINCTCGSFGSLGVFSFLFLFFGSLVGVAASATYSFSSSPSTEATEATDASASAPSVCYGRIKDVIADNAANILLSIATK